MAEWRRRCRVPDEPYWVPFRAGATGRPIHAELWWVGWVKGGGQKAGSCRWEHGGTRCLPDLGGC